ncbi:MAG: 4a-hydroxytetrahydrobiopterin dehydratase [Akkermansiaceae bacterium]|nr:4a-hydroxytetrahydrobiopterin dehydratase [Armatimonadota bacterium]
MKKLTEAEIAEHLKAVPEWQIKNGVLSRTFSFTDFVASMRFVNGVAEAAEKANHHPDIDIRYNKVTLGLVTHDAGGITQSDFALAGESDEIV